MRDEAEIPVLRRKAGGGRAAIGLTAMTPLKALRLAVARAGDETLGCPVGVRELAEDTVLPEALGDSLPEPCLVVQLDGPGEARAMAAACPQVIGAAIEAQTMGKVQAAAAAARALTRTDAIMLAEFLDRLLSGFAALVGECADPPPVGGYSFAAALPDIRAATMILQDAPHRQFKIDLDFANGAKTGVLHLIVPAKPAAGAAGPKAAQWQATLKNSVLGTTARLEAVLGGLRLPLRDVTAMAVGDVVKLDMASLNRVSLIGVDGAKMITASLGRSGLMRAVRLNLSGAAPEVKAGTLALKQVSAPLPEQAPDAAAAADAMPGPQDPAAPMQPAPMPMPAAADPATPAPMPMPSPMPMPAPMPMPEAAEAEPLAPMPMPMPMPLPGGVGD